jgi:hypothetical protein
LILTSTRFLSEGHIKKNVTPKDYELCPFLNIKIDFFREESFAKYFSINSISLPNSIVCVSSRLSVSRKSSLRRLIIRTVSLFSFFKTNALIEFRLLNRKCGEAAKSADRADLSGYQMPEKRKQSSGLLSKQ